MKLNSHLIGICFGIACIVGWMWYTDKVVEANFNGYQIIKRRGKYVAEHLPGERNTNPEFGTMDEVHAWVLAQSATGAVTSMLNPGQAATASAIANALPWNQ